MEQNLAVEHVAVAAEWHPTRNGNVRAEQVRSSSHKVVWWLCPDGHEYEASVKHRTRERSGCPWCSGRRTLTDRSLLAMAPDRAALWDMERNTATPAEVGPASTRTVHWRCPAGPDHTWTAQVQSVHGCPFCSGARVSVTTCLMTVRPDLAALWHPGNGVSPEAVHAGSATDYRWRCEDGHEWVMSPDVLRRRATLCMQCDGGLAWSTRGSLQQERPDIAALWDWDANDGIEPGQVSAASGRVAAWRCPEGHRWTGAVADRVGSRGCPWCTGFHVTEAHSLAAMHPEVAARWHETLNGALSPDQVHPRSNRKAWFTCDFGHAYQGVIGAVAIDRWGCSTCWTPSSSRVEVALHEVLSTVYVVGDHGSPFRVPGTRGRPRTPDIVLTRHRVVIEFDGAYWHAPAEVRRKDLTAFDFYASQGYQVVRLREAPLEPLGPMDVVVPAVQRAADAATLGSLVIEHLTNLGFAPDLDVTELADAQDVDETAQPA